MVLHEQIASVRSDSTPVKPPSKVRVTFFESQKPHFVSSPDTPDDLDLPIMATPSPTQDKPGYLRQESTESGRDNPFRPDGDLSKEADEIVGLIKEGKPIVGTPTRQGNDLTDSVAGSPVRGIADGGPQSPVREAPISASRSNPVYAHNAKGGVNGAAHTGPLTPEAIEVQRGVVVPAKDAEVEHVTIKKKPKCQCCEIM